MRGSNGVTEKVAPERPLRKKQRPKLSDPFHNCQQKDRPQLARFAKGENWASSVITRHTQEAASYFIDMRILWIFIHDALKILGNVAAYICACHVHVCEICGISHLSPFDPATSAWDHGIYGVFFAPGVAETRENTTYLTIFDHYGIEKKAAGQQQQEQEQKEQK